MARLVQHDYRPAWVALHSQESPVAGMRICCSAFDLNPRDTVSLVAPKGTCLQ